MVTSRVTARTTLMAERSMFDKLLESRAKTQSRRGSSFAAIAIHAAIIAAAVALTANAAVTGHASVPEKIFFARQTPPPPVDATTSSPARPSNTASSVQTVPLAPAFIAPVVIPDLVLEIDAGVIARPDIDFSRSSVGSGGVGVNGSRADGLTSGDVFSEFQVDRSVALSPGAPAPVYPPSLRDAGVAGDLMAEFVVDTLGRADMTSVRLTGTDRVAFEAAVRRVLPEYRFRAAEYGGRKVRQRVQLPFRFLLDRQE